MNEEKIKVLLELASKFDKKGLEDAKLEMLRLRTQMQFFSRDIKKIRQDKLNDALLIAQKRYKYSAGTIREVNVQRAIELEQIRNEIRMSKERVNEVNSTIRSQTKSLAAIEALTAANISTSFALVNLKQKQQATNQIMNTAGNAVSTHTRKLKNNRQGMDRIIDVLGEYKEGIKKAAISHHKLTGAMLGVMFFGMAIRSMFLSLFNPVMEAYGVMDLFSAMLLVIMLPVMEMIYPIFLSIAEFFMNLPQPVQLAIGIFAALAVVFGTILMVVGMLTLGIVGIMLGLTTLGITGAAIGTFFAGLFAPFLIIIGAVILAVLLFRQAFESNFLGIKDFVQQIWDGIKGIFQGAVDIISGIWGMLISLFKGDLTGFVEGFKKFFLGIAELFAGVYDLVVGLFATIGILFLQLVKNIFNFGYSIGEALGEGLKSAWSWITDAFWGWLPSFSELKKRVLGIFGGGDSGSSSGSSSSGSSPKKFNDMIWRPGSDPVSISPQDTLVATKGGPAGGSSVVYNNTNNIQVLDKYELQRILDARDSKLLDELRRLTRGA